MITIKINNLESKKEIILTNYTFRLFLIIFDVMFGWIMVALSFILFMGTYLIPIIIVLILVFVNLLIFLSKVVLTKDLKNGSISLQKQFIFKHGPIIYKMSEKPYFKLISPVEDYFVLVIESNEKGNSIGPTSWGGGKSNFVFKIEEINKMADILKIPVSKEVGGLSQLLFKYIGR